MKSRITLLVLALTGAAMFVLTVSEDSSRPVRVEAASAPEPAPVASLAPVVPVAPEAAAPNPVEVPAVVEPAQPASPPSAPPIAPLAVVATPSTVCEVTSAGNGSASVWGVYGKTDLPNGTEFTFTLTVDGVATSYPLVARTGGAILINGQSYGKDGYTPQDGVFGFTQADIPHTGPYATASGVVSRDGEVLCAG